MSLLRATKHVVARGRGIGPSYAGISRTRCQEITLMRSDAPASYRNFSRTCSNKESAETEIKSENNIRQILDDYKKTNGLKFNSIAWMPYHINRPRLGTEIELEGYLMNRRDINKNLSFTMLRSPTQEYAIQIVSSGQEEGSQAAEAHTQLKTLREFTPVKITGTLEPKQPAKNAKKNAEDGESPKLADHTREIYITHILPLAEIPSDLIVKEGSSYGPHQRHLQLRTSSELRRRLKFRNRANRIARSILHKKGDFVEVETPLLFKSTPEGAREFLVPTRRKGLAYALPQSPQQYKQLLVAAGHHRYFQFAKCFRDEDLRADRQPEFTQLDLELAFASDEEVMYTVDSLIRPLFSDMLACHIPTIQRITYNEAMSRYGSDKPDLRFPAQIHNITKYLPEDLIRKITPLENPTVEAFRMTLDRNSSINHKFISNFLDGPEGKPFLENPHGQPGTFIGDVSKPLGGLAALGHRAAMEIPSELSIDQGDILVLQARPTAPHSGGSTVLGNLRTALYKAAIAAKLCDAPPRDKFVFAWITDFPLFTPSNDQDPGQGGTAGFSSTHHPFTAPKTDADVDSLLTDPSRAVAAHYDLVVNGVELGGGSRRIHNAQVQEFIFRDVLKMKPERIEDFRHLLDALRSGCPPHAGFALGWDRLIAMMTGTDSVRDVIAFPKTGSGEDPMVGSPNMVTKEQWDTYHLEVKT
ncbi:unnamed protein product [Periconia digitata]|uniref:Aminoacyl-transfer RNA synthetases class-II family profile domain-containing protein n=1 Tax=Periconia digitata TaxID=1303443 RepID=A0A9W4XKU2_9PLEO|nr:unnamed protein product [Periconia digitata]